MDNKAREEVLKAIDNENAQNLKTILVIKSKPKLSLDENDDVTLNEGYEFEVDAAIPEIADAIAKFALELPKNGQGENSDTGFIQYINLFFSQLKEQK